MIYSRVREKERFMKKIEEGGRLYLMEPTGERHSVGAKKMRSTLRKRQVYRIQEGVTVLMGPVRNFWLYRLE